MSLSGVLTFFGLDVFAAAWLHKAGASYKRSCGPARPFKAYAVLTHVQYILELLFAAQYSVGTQSSRDYDCVSIHEEDRISLMKDSVRPSICTYIIFLSLSSHTDSLKARLQELWLPLLQIDDHLPEQTIRPREPLPRPVGHIEAVHGLMDQT